MNNSLLEMIDDYIRKNGIPFKDVWVSRTYFPEEFNKLVDKEFKKLNSKAVVNKDYCFTYDENGHLLLQAFSYNTRLVLCDSPKDVKVNYPCTKMYFDRIFYKACINKYNKEEYDRFREILLEHDPMIDDDTLEELLGRFMNVINNKIEKELMKNDEDIFQRETELFTDYIRTYNRTKEYIDYLNNEYNKTLTGDVLIYEQNISDVEPRKYSNVHLLKGKNGERKYSQIPVSERLSTLESYDYLFKCQAREKNSDMISQLCYLYKTDDNEYKMIIEPYSGEKITRVISINTEEEMTRDEFMNYAYTYLCMSNKDILASKNIAQLYHTTYQTFKNSVGYAITGDEKIEINGYTKNNLVSISKSGHEPKL